MLLHLREHGLYQMRPAGDPGPDAVAVAVAYDVLAEELDELRALGPRSDEAHVAAQHVSSCGARPAKCGAGTAPLVVRRSAPSTPPGAVSPPSRNSSGSAVRVARPCVSGLTHRAELVEVEELPSRPTRRCRNNAGPGRAQANRERGQRPSPARARSAASAAPPVERVLEGELQALRVDCREGQERQPANSVVADAVVDRVEHPRHHRDLDTELLAPLDEAADACVGDRGEGDDQVLDAGPPDGLLEVLDGAQDRDVAASDLGDRPGSSSRKPTGMRP